MPVVTVHRAGRRLLDVDIADGATIGRSTACTVVLKDPAVAELHATIRDPDRGDDIALYLAPGASAVVAGDTVRGRARLWSPRCLFSIGLFEVTIADIEAEVPTDFSIRFGGAAEAVGSTYEPHDAVEAELVGSLRMRPNDDAIREVYADWLEEHGFDLRARLLRAETIAAQPGLDISVRIDNLAPPEDHAWRAVASRAPIERCVGFRKPCPKSWSALATTANDAVRHCATCSRPVYYCASIDEARARGASQDCIAIDAAVARGEALTAYDGADDILMGEIAGEDT